MRFASACLLSAAFAALAVAVAAGVFTGLDQWSVLHLMPGAQFRNNEGGILEAVIPLWGTHWHNVWSIAANVVTLPASFVVALAIALRRSPPIAVMIVAGTAVEALCKETLTRPMLFDATHYTTGFDTSFPSGHALRTVLVAAVVARPLAAAWAVGSIALLQLAGWHTPTDIAGGLLLGLLGLLGARALRGRRLLRSAAR
jgi:membrane-associated phospholipid phosphatase